MTNTLLHGDCLELLQDIPDDSIDLVVTDPPYCVGATSNGVKGTFLDNNLIRPFFKELFAQWQRVLKDGSHVYICTDWRTYPFLYSLVQTYFTMRNLIVWDKSPYMNAGNWYRYTHEFIIFATKGKSKRNFAANIRDIWSIPADKMVKTTGRFHPSQKPTALFEEMIGNSSVAGDVVLDCFLGSGTAAVAAINLGRRYIGMEIDEHYYDVALKRLAASF